MVKWPNFRNFIGDNQTVMNKNKPLDQVCSIGANALNLTSKLVNKSEFNGSTLERLMDFAGSVPDFRRSDKGNIRHRYGVEDRLEGSHRFIHIQKGPNSDTAESRPGLTVSTTVLRLFNRRAYLRKKVVCKQSANRHAGSRGICAEPLVNREYALGTGRQSPARQHKTEVTQSCPQS